MSEGSQLCGQGYSDRPPEFDCMFRLQCWSADWFSICQGTKRRGGAAPRINLNPEILSFTSMNIPAMASQPEVVPARPGLHLQRSQPRVCFRRTASWRGISQPSPRQVVSRQRSLRTFAQQNFATQLIGGAFGGANEVFVAGRCNVLHAHITVGVRGS